MWNQVTGQMRLDERSSETSDDRQDERLGEVK